MDQGSRIEDLTAVVVLTLMVGIVVKFMLLLLGVSGPIGLISVGLAALAGYVCRPKGGNGDWREGTGLITLIAGLAFLGIAYVFSPGYTLPAHDPIAVPVLANVIAQGKLPIEAFEIGTSAATYPPGQPILLSAVGAALTPVDQLLALKWLVLASVSLIPLTWAWFHHRFFGSVSYVSLVIC